MRRVVLDTNVLVSALLSPLGAPAWILDLVVSGDIVLFYDVNIFDEYRRVLVRPELRLPSELIDDTLRAIEGLATEVTAPPWAHPLPDPSDEPFLRVAKTAGASLITGNLRHFPSNVRSSVPVLTPRQYIEQWKR